jgi:hypothetical protein
MSAGGIVLITGSAGRIGQAVVSELKARNYRVRGFDRARTPGLPDSVVGDIADAKAVTRSVEGVDTIIHLAATPDDADFMTELLPNNIIGIYNVMEAARLGGARRIILSSSGQVNWWQRGGDNGPCVPRIRRVKILVRRGQDVRRIHRPGIRRDPWPECHCRPARIVSPERGALP